MAASNRKRFKRLLLWGPAGFFCVALLGYAILPWPVRLRWRDPDTTSFMRYRMDQAADSGETLEIRHAWVPLDKISKNMQRAVILAEDGRFEEHEGIDWLALAEEVHWDGDDSFSWFSGEDLKSLSHAFEYYATHRDEVKGRSTITQQLAKNLYYTPERSLTRKAAEFLVAQRLEWFLTKDRIMELYLNTVELGPGIFGVEAAAKAYFNTSAAKLTQFQAASLAGTLPHPLSSNPAKRPSRMAWRRDIILRRMTGGSADLTPVPVMPDPDSLIAAPDSTAPTPDSLGGEPLPVTPDSLAPVTPPAEPVPPPPDTASGRP
jgi:monofunctional glycosyltransferase